MMETIEGEHYLTVCYEDSAAQQVEAATGKSLEDFTVSAVQRILELKQLKEEGRLKRLLVEWPNGRFSDIDY